MSSCFWFRTDLRLKDNLALKKANNDDLIALFIITPNTWQQHHFSDCKVDLILRRLAVLSQELDQLNIPLKIINVKTFDAIPAAITAFCVKHEIDTLYANKELLINEAQRDKRVKKALAEKDISFLTFDDMTVLPTHATLKQDGTPFKVFTPFKRNWLKVVTPDCYLADTEALKKQKKLKIASDDVPKKIAGFLPTPDIAENWPVDTRAITRRLNTFCNEKAADYEKNRDFPALCATSQLSAYLATGCLSVRQCITALCDAVDAHDIYHLSKGASCWLNELIWREFYQGVVCHFPDVVKGEPFKPNTKKLRWSKSEKNFEAWCVGQTGFPLVDAGMRQLNQTGWMHNRLRMVVAMFLTKTLFIDWRQGEAYFMQHLVDGEFAANNGGWQWSASTGTDAVPYFRIFNPTTQSERFDKEGDFIRHYCPELAACDNKQIHNPSSTLRKELGYPQPIVDYKVMRAKVMAAFKELG